MNIFGALWLTTIFMLWNFQFPLSEGAKILALLNVASPSHHIFNRVLTTELAARGHQVTAASVNIEKNPHPNLKYIHLEGVYDNLDDIFDYEGFADMSTIGSVFTMFEWGSYTCERSLKSEGAKTLLKLASTEKFDLIVTEASWGDCFHALIHKFGHPPVVAMSAFGIVPWTSNLMGTPYNPAYMPSFLLPYSSEMTFYQRAHNFLIQNLLFYCYNNFYIPRQDALIKDYLKEDFPPILDIQRNFSILLANSVFGLESAVPVAPNVVPVGGMHIKTTPDPLPKDIQEFLDGAKDGFIFFSLGSNLHSDTLPKEKLRALLDAFVELPQRILWKFESDNLPGQPPNVKIGKWLPQSDIFAHPNIRLFISHCGKMSSTEATYRGVPMVGIPFFVDQIMNLELLKQRGVAVELNYHTLSKEKILTAVREVLNNKSYEQNMKRLSAIYRDHPQSALDRAIFWTEYAIRHGGAPHLRPASTDLYWYQYLLLDVIFVFISGSVIVLAIAFILIRKILNIIMGRSPQNKTKKTN